MKPVIKWVGGKTQMLSQLRELITPELLEGHTYYEPFIGGGALAFDLEYKNTVIGDLNSELINMYKMIKARPEDLIELLRSYWTRHCEEEYYKIRALDRDPQYTIEEYPLSHAARTIYLNKFCFNGLYRVNSKGYFNSPIGRTTSGKPPILPEEEIRALSKFLQTVEIYNLDYNAVVCKAKEGDIVFLDPPYDPDEDISTGGFVGYQQSGWTRQDTDWLKEVVDKLTAWGVKVVLTNNNTTYIRELFKNYKIIEVDVRRSINRDGNKRTGKEVIITNY